VFNEYKSIFVMHTDFLVTLDKQDEEKLSQ
jgi:hypothetical protein